MLKLLSLFCMFSMCLAEEEAMLSAVTVDEKNVELVSVKWRILIIWL